jgi:hypothetical protein
MEEVKLYTCRWERLDRTTDYRVCDLPEGIDLAGLKSALEMPLYDDVKVEVSLDAQVFVSVSEPFRFFESPRVYYAEPFISAMEGGVPVTIHGQNFHKGPTNILCKFGEPVDATENVLSVATFINQRTLICISPPFRTNRVVSVKVLLLPAVRESMSCSAGSWACESSMAPQKRSLLLILAFVCRSASTRQRATIPRTMLPSSFLNRGRLRA